MSLALELVGKEYKDLDEAREHQKGKLVAPCKGPMAVFHRGMPHTEKEFQETTRHSWLGEFPVEVADQREMRQPSGYRY